MQVAYDHFFRAGRQLVLTEKSLHTVNVGGVGKGRTCDLGKHGCHLANVIMVDLH
jgi:hypothetical protein